jgi:hypothetical protein
MRPKVKSPPPTVKTDTLVEFRSYLKIDKNSLTEAMAEQADLFFRVGEECALAVSRRDEAKEALSTVDAELGQELRNGKKTEDRVTEGAIKDKIQTNPRHLRAFEAHTEAKKQAERLVALRDAFQERGRMLRDLGQLYAAGYFTVESSKGAAADIGRAALASARRASSK